MGTTLTKLSLVGDGEEIVLETMADTGATYSVFPREVLDSLGIQPAKVVEIQLGDGSIITRKMGSAKVRLNGDTFPVTVIFGESGDTSVLGLTALEIFGLSVDPVNRRLVPARILWL
ncbi:MAG: aspartyl protease family protein [Methylococcales bacterium]